MRVRELPEVGPRKGKYVIGYALLACRIEVAGGNTQALPQSKQINARK